MRLKVSNAEDTEGCNLYIAADRSLFISWGMHRRREMKSIAVFYSYLLPCIFAFRKLIYASV